MTRRARAIAAIVIAALVLTTGGRPASVSAGAQQQLDPDEAALRALLQRLERATQAASPDGYLELLGTQADRAGATRFATAEFRPGTNRIVVQERDRQRCRAQVGASCRLLDGRHLLFGGVGPRGGSCSQIRHSCFQRVRGAAFGRQAGYVQKHRQILRLELENPVELLLGFSIAFRRAEAFGFLRERIQRVQVLRIQFYGAFQVSNCFGLPSAAAFDEAEQSFNPTVSGR